MSSWHTSIPKPSHILALVALGIVLRFRPTWVAVELGEVARQEGQSAERISRLISRAIGPFEHVVSVLTQRGRPHRASKQSSVETELALTRELLGVTTALLACVSLKGDRIREHIVGAWQRLSQNAGMTQQRFCDALALPARTLRAWLKCPSHARPMGNAPPQAKPKKRKRPPRRGRFNFEVTLPDTQIASDTTDVSAFGIPLKVIAAQDIGGRDEDLFDSVVVDDSESAGHVIVALEKVLSQLPGAQAITDQGKPYMARAVSEMLDVQAVEHAPQKEADPLGKATIERAFLTLKSIAAPILRLTDQLADAWPQLRDATLAKSITHLFFSAILRAYQHGARAARTAIQARGSIDEATLARLAEASRERARATERSARLLLRHVHSIYAFPGSIESFINELRRYPIHVLRDAEHALRNQMHRDDIRDKRTYFAAIVRRLHDEHVQRRRREAWERLCAERDASEQKARRARIDAWSSDPVAWLHTALDMLASQWQSKTQSLLFDGDGLGLGWMRSALERLFSLHGPAAIDMARGALHAFRATYLDRLGPTGVAAIEVLANREIDHRRSSKSTPCTPTDPSAILSATGINRRRPPENRLRI